MLLIGSKISFQLYILPCAFTYIILIVLHNNFVS